MSAASTLRGSIAAALVLCVAGCASSATTSTTAAPASKPPTAISPSPVSSADPVTYVPTLTGFSKVFTTAADRSGADILADIATVPAGTFGVFLECRGPDTMWLDLGTLGKFKMSCGSKTTPNYDEIGLGSEKKNITVSVSTSPEDRWSIAVGWHAGSRGPA
jgi:hypothetical protein